MEKEDITNIIAKAEASQGTSKAGREYRMLILTLSNGYEKRIFLDNAEWFVVDELLAGNDGKIKVKTGE